MGLYANTVHLQPPKNMQEPKGVCSMGLQAYAIKDMGTGMGSAATAAAAALLRTGPPAGQGTKVRLDSRAELLAVAMALLAPAWGAGHAAH
jgi:hypothetical protein